MVVFETAVDAVELVVVRRVVRFVIDGLGVEREGFVVVVFGHGLFGERAEFARRLVIVGVGCRRGAAAGCGGGAGGTGFHVGGGGVGRCEKEHRGCCQATDHAVAHHCCLKRWNGVRVRDLIGFQILSLA